MIRLVAIERQCEEAMSGRSSQEQFTVKQLQDVNRQWKDQYSKLERDSSQQIRQLNVKLVDLEHELASVRHQLNDAKRKEASAAGNQDDLRVMQGQYESVSGQLQFLQSKYESAMTAIDELKSEIKRLKEGRQRVDERGNSNEQVLQHQVGVLRQDIMEERREREKLQREIGRLAAEKLELQDENMALRQQLEQYNTHYRHGNHP